MVADGLLLAGDYLSESFGSFEGCLDSAEAAAQQAAEQLARVKRGFAEGSQERKAPKAHENHEK